MGDDLKWTLNRMLDALQQPILDYDQVARTAVSTGSNPEPLFIEPTPGEMPLPEDSAASSAMGRHIALGSTIFADEHGSYDVLHAKYKTFRINHRLSYSNGQACTNQAESFHSRMRRAEIGQYHRISGPYLEQYAFEIAYRSDRRRAHNGAIFHELGEMALRHPVSRRWKGYWQARASGQPMKLGLP